jgi:hypothetical protein
MKLVRMAGKPCMPPAATTAAESHGAYPNRGATAVQCGGVGDRIHLVTCAVLSRC